MPGNQIVINKGIEYYVGDSKEGLDMAHQPLWRRTLAPPRGGYKRVSEALLKLPIIIFGIKRPLLPL